jgi:CRISPR-associated protein Csx16
MALTTTVPMGHRTFFLSRHPGAVDWARRQGLAVDHWLAHLDVAQVQPGDTVIGTLPIHLAAQVCARGGRYLHLSLDMPAELRGRELSADELERAGARLEGYSVLASGIECFGAGRNTCR